MNLEERLRAVFPHLNSFDAIEARKALEKLKGADQPEEQAVLVMLASALERHGSAGLLRAEAAVDKMMKGRAVRMDFADLATASNTLMVLQRMEAKRRDEVMEFTRGAVYHIGRIAGTLIKAALLG